MSETVIFKPAQRVESRLNLGLAGPSGSGKTLAALRLAYGLTGDWSKVFVIDSEHGSASLYQGDQRWGIGQFMHYNLDKPFSPARYVAAMEAAIRAGAQVIVADQISHAWSGSGGVLQIKEAAERTGRYNNYTAWAVATPEHERLFETIITSPVHMICTMRSKTEYELQTDDRGKKKPVKIGMAPIQRSEVEYEWTVMLDLDRETHKARVSKTRSPVVNDAEEYEVNEELGKKFMVWLSSAVGYAPVGDNAQYAAPPAPGGRPGVATTTLPGITKPTPKPPVPSGSIIPPGAGQIHVISGAPAVVVTSEPALATNDRPWKDESLSTEDARNVMYAFAVAEWGFADVDAVRAAIRTAGKWTAIPDIATVNEIADYLSEASRPEQEAA